MVDEDVVVAKLESVNEYTNDLKRMRDVSPAEYAEDVVLQRAVERTFMNLIQSCIDLARHIRASDALGETETAKDEIRELGRAEVISQETQRQLEEAVGFRNVLAHRYGEVDHGVVYDVLQNDLEWFERFQREIASWFQRVQ